jgi:fatty acid desaturase
MASARMLRQSRADLWLVALAAAYGLLLVTRPSVTLVAIGLWWTANTVAHNFIHAPFFRSRGANAAFSAYLSLLMGVPQRLWRARHLAHHAEDARATWTDARARRPWRWTRPMIGELLLVLALWATIALVSPRALVFVYLPGWLLGLALCQLQGYFEHARGTTSHYGRLYNLLFFNDGYHVEHHARPGEHWTRLPAIGHRDAAASAWPPVLRWMEVRASVRWLDALERLVLRSPPLRRFVLRVHERALRDAVGASAGVQRILVVGGGLFPRTALALRRLFPTADITVLDADASHLATAAPFLDDRITLRHGAFPGTAALAPEADLVVVPLAFDGDRDRVYAHPPAPIVVVHDWLWHPRGRSVVVSPLLLKRVNVIERDAA